ncbi:MAG: radical SAM protein [Candidatus Omnitrophota bacterium]|nr:radical SAM protein [Candidatus Omnitrophota bacterium]MBU1929773.1 radical SAM protein [Candidatus Omnitrophota bacterium]MBU2035225.1 radical SAM protein [Candidatus Omnitrophota bacterium]MBU2220986.1 radical SAM protein [Candidatus Omnitrophota bacterium]MBU2258786.1 radical SAM protein [Candidatus Omnitrophota bacterium]
MKYIYGPVNSRRLGLSLGINLTPYKICSFNCIYCQLGKTTDKTIERKEYFKAQDIIEELKNWIQNNPGEADKINYVTFSGSGEPTLNINIGYLIRQIKSITNIKIAVITNASLLNSLLIRQELMSADLIIPSLDAVSEDIFAEIDRPAEALKLDGLIEGLVSLSKEFQGKIWLEVMMIKGVNDSPGHIDRLKEVIEKIRPDKIHLNSPVRVTVEPDIRPLSAKKLEEIKEILGGRCEIA